MEWNGGMDYGMDCACAQRTNHLVVDLPAFSPRFYFASQRSAVSTMAGFAGTSSNPIVLDCTSSPETSLSPLKVVKTKEMYIGMFKYLILT